MTRHAFRFAPRAVPQDPDATPTYQAWCVSGGEQECGEDSGEWLTPHPVQVWMDAHVEATGHRHYRRAFCDGAGYGPPDGPAAAWAPGHP